MEPVRFLVSCTHQMWRVSQAVGEGAGDLHRPAPKLPSGRTLLSHWKISVHVSEWLETALAECEQAHNTIHLRASQQAGYGRRIYPLAYPQQALFVGLRSILGKMHQDCGSGKGVIGLKPVLSIRIFLKPRTGSHTLQTKDGLLKPQDAVVGKT